MLKFINGDKYLFERVEEALFYGLVKSLEEPGAHSQEAYLLAGEKCQFFIKPDKTNNYLKEVLAWELSKKLGLQDYFLPVCAFELHKNDKSVVATANPMMPEEYVSIQDLEHDREGSLNGILEPLIRSGIGHRIAFFDLLMGNKDRHRNNIFTANGKIICIDHSEAFTKSEHGWIPAILRKSGYKKGQPLPLCENEYELRKWVDSLQFSKKEFQDKLEQIKSAPGRIDENINKWWLSNA